MDAFFASVAQLDHPELRGKPVLIGGDGPRSVVAAASYEARAFGCHSALPMAIAKRRCPQAVIVAHDGPRYRELSRRAFEVFEQVTPIVQPRSIDEAYLDVTGSIPLLGPGRAIAEHIRAEVRRVTGGLTCSVGVAPNKALAKIASELHKPDGLTVIEPEDAQAVLDPLPVSAIAGVGAAAERSLARLGVRTIAQLRGLPIDVLEARLGKFGAELHSLARGIDDRPVTTDRETKSIGHERTFDQDLEDPDEVRGVLCGLAEDSARRLRRAGRLARTVTLKIRFGEFQTQTRARTLEAATDATAPLWQAADALFTEWARSFRPVRLVGVSLSGLTEAGESGANPGRQMDLFAEPESPEARARGERARELDKATDAIAHKFGKHAIRRARAIRPDREREPED